MVEGASGSAGAAGDGGGGDAGDGASGDGASGVRSSGDADSAAGESPVPLARSTRTKASTQVGQNCFPAIRCISWIAKSSGSPTR